MIRVLDIINLQVQVSKCVSQEHKIYLSLYQIIFFSTNIKVSFQNITFTFQYLTKNTSLQVKYFMKIWLVSQLLVGRQCENTYPRMGAQVDWGGC